MREIREMEILRQRGKTKYRGTDKERICQRDDNRTPQSELGRGRKERESVHVGEGRWGLVEGAGRGGVSNITLMNQCQWSDEKIIKKQDSTVLNTAKGKGPILLYKNTISMEKKNGNKRGKGKRGRENLYHNGCQNALQMAL